MSVEIVGIGDLAYWAACRCCCPCRQLFQCVVAIRCVGHGIAGDSTQAVSFVVGIGEGFSGSGLGEGVARVVIGITPELCPVLPDRAQTVVVAAIILGAVGGGAEERGIVGDAVSHPVVAKAF